MKFEHLKFHSSVKFAVLKFNRKQQESSSAEAMNELNETIIVASASIDA